MSALGDWRPVGAGVARCHGNTGCRGATDIPRCFSRSVGGASWNWRRSPWSSVPSLIHSPLGEESQLHANTGWDLNSHLDFKNSLRVVVIRVCVPSDGCVSVCRSFGDRGAQYGGESLEIRLTPLFRDAASDSSSSLTSNKQTHSMNVHWVMHQYISHLWQSQNALQDAQTITGAMHSKRLEEQGYGENIFKTICCLFNSWPKHNSLIFIKE